MLSIFAIVTPFSRLAIFHILQYTIYIEFLRGFV